MSKDSSDGKICAMFRQSWYEAAVKNMKPMERLMFYETCFDYEFSIKEPDNEQLPAIVSIMFDMVRDTIDRDREKAMNRVRAAQLNGMLGGRPTSNNRNNNTTEPNNNPAEPNNNPTVKLGSALHNNITQQITDYLYRSLNRSKIDIELLFYCTLFFFEQGAVNAIEEGEKFFAYYQARGWKTNSGVKVADKYALAKGWKIENKSIEAVQRRKYYCNLISSLKVADLSLIEDFRNCIYEPQSSEIILLFKNKRIPMLLEKEYHKQTEIWFKELGLKKLEYQCMQS